MVNDKVSSKVSSRVNGLVKRRVTAYSKPHTNKIEVIELPRHKPPSRIRYEKSHPTISFRLDQELKSRLEEVLEKESFASFVKEALGKREREKKSRKEAREEGYEAGYSEGYKEATDRFAVHTSCVICGEDIIVESDGDKRELARVMTSMGGRHPHCKDAEYQYRD